MSEQQVKKSVAERVAAVDTTIPATCTTTASKVRHLATVLKDKDGNADRGAIAKCLGIRYQWVRNVLITPVKA